MLGLVHFDAGADRDASGAATARSLSGCPPPRSRAARHPAALAGAPARRDRAASSSKSRRRRLRQQRAAVGHRHRERPLGGATDRAAFLAGDLESSGAPSAPARGLTSSIASGRSRISRTRSIPTRCRSTISTHRRRLDAAPRLTLAAGVDGYVLFAGVRRSRTFQAGAPSAHASSARAHGLETRLRASTSSRLARSRLRLPGRNRDEAGVPSSWRDRAIGSPRLRLRARGHRHAGGAAEPARLPLAPAAASIPTPSTSSPTPTSGTSRRSPPCATCPGFPRTRRAALRISRLRGSRHTSRLPTARLLQLRTASRQSLRGRPRVAPSDRPTASTSRPPTRSSSTLDDRQQRRLDAARLR